MTHDIRETLRTNGAVTAPQFGYNNKSSPLPTNLGQTTKSAQVPLASTLINVLGVLMRDPGFRGMRLSDVEWLVIPPVLAGQCRLAQIPMPVRHTVTTNGELMPVAVVLWARVSDAIDARLAGALDKPVDLRSTEWTTGDNFWLMAVAGDPRVVPTLLEQLEAHEFKDKKTRLRARGPGDRTVIVSLSAYLQPRS